MNDWVNMVKLFVAVAKAGHAYEPGHAALQRKIEKRFDALKQFL